MLFPARPAYSLDINLSNSGNGSWKYKETIIINNPSSELADYQLFISTSLVNTKKLIADGALQPDFDDVRFSDTGYNELNYWISPDTINPCGFWVKMHVVWTGSGTSIIFYYGNSSATASSNAYDSFLFYDDFNDISRWKTTAGSWEIIDGQLYSSGEGNNLIRTLKQQPHSGINVEFKAVNQENNNIRFEWKQNKKDGYLLNISTTNAYFNVLRNNAITGSYPLPASVTNLREQYIITDYNGKIGITCGTSPEIWIDSQPYVSGDYFTLGATGETYFDDLIIRNYTQPEPAAFIGREIIIFPPEKLLCDGETNPSGVVNESPEFSWQFNYTGGYAHEKIPQYAYRIFVSSLAQTINNPEPYGAMWDSGIAQSTEETAAYSGNKLLSNTTYYWKVMTWLNEVSTPTCSETQQFLFALNNPPEKPLNLLCDNNINPAAMAKIKPVFSWEFNDPDPKSSQEYFRLIISSNINIPDENSINSDSGKLQSAVSSMSYMGAPFNPGTTYYWKVLTWDDGGLASQASEVQSFNFIYDPALYPQFVKNLTARPIKGRKIELKWLASVSADTAGYGILYSTGGFNKKYTVEHESVPVKNNFWISPALKEGTMYSFIVRVYNADGYQENNQNAVSATAAFAPVLAEMALFNIPENGRRISGNRFTLMAESSEADKAGNMFFEYRNQNSAEWLSLHGCFKTANSPGFACFWDLNTAGEGNYNIRTVCEDKSGNKNSSGSWLTITVDNKNPDIIENVNDNTAIKTEVLDNRIDNTIKLFGIKSSGITEVLLPAGSINNNEAKLTLEENPAGIPIPHIEELVPAGELYKISLEGAALNQCATVSVPYKDDDGNRIVDGTNPPVLEDDLKVFAYNQEARGWNEVTDRKIDRETKQVVFNTGYFSLYSLQGKGLVTLGNPFNYPNPFGDGGTAFMYELAENSYVSIKIYTVSGRFVKSLVGHTPKTMGAYEEFWDGTDDSSPPASLANGQYFYRIIAETAGGKTIEKIGKLVIIR